MVAEPVLVAVELSFIVNLVMLLMGIYTRELPRRSLLDSGQAGEPRAALSWTQDKPESCAPLSPEPRTSRSGALRLLRDCRLSGARRSCIFFPEEKAAEVYFTCIHSRINPAPLATISSHTERPLSTIYSRPSSMSETWMSEETVLPSTTL